MLLRRNDQLIKRGTGFFAQILRMLHGDLTVDIVGLIQSTALSFVEYLSKKYVLMLSQETPADDGVDPSPPRETFLVLSQYTWRQREQTKVNAG